MIVLVTLRYRSDSLDTVRAWGSGVSFQDAIYYLARHAFVGDMPAFDEPMVLRVYRGAVAERQLAALQRPVP